MEQKGLQKQRCIKCGSTLIYIRIKTGERVCRYCGFIQKGEKNGE